MSKRKALRRLIATFKMDRFCNERTAVYEQDAIDEAYSKPRFWIGYFHALIAECKDHRKTLLWIRKACEHGLVGTEPDDYDEWGYGDNEAPVPYDAYTEVIELLQAEDRCPPLKLSPSLRAHLEVMPASAGAKMDVFAGWLKEAGIATYSFGADGSATTQPPGATDSWGLDAQVEAVSLTVFAETYDADMAELLRLAQARAPFPQLLALL